MMNERCWTVKAKTQESQLHVNISVTCGGGSTTVLTANGRELLELIAVDEYEYEYDTDDVGPATLTELEEGTGTTGAPPELFAAAPNANCIIATPATVLLSATVVLLDDTSAYTVPCSPTGSIAVPVTVVAVVELVVVVVLAICCGAPK